MKKIITASIIIACSFLNKTIAQANRTLSNLIATTAINTNLLPGTTGSINMGSAANSWKDVGSMYGLYGKVISFDGCHNVAIGMHTLKQNTGTSNTAVGFATMTLNTTGYDNSAFGEYALNTNTTGSGNSAMGISTTF